jgi:hypothetical protein
MADFCTRCSYDLFGNEIKPDIDVALEFSKLTDGYCVEGFICEGCGLSTIAKINGDLRVLRGDSHDWEQY